jgi:hypothetical protein
MPNDHAADDETDSLFALFAIVEHGEGPGGLVHHLGDDPTRTA